MTQLFEHAIIEQKPLPHNITYIADNDNALNILLVEDNYNDTLLAIQAVKSVHIPCNLERMTRGEDVLPFLKNCMHTHLPDILFLDMGLPDLDGFEILSMLAEAPAALRAIPVAIITGYSHFEYLPRAYQLPILGYVTKPLRSHEIEPILSKVMDFKH